MVIVKIYGGLGNELFQYALYRKLQSLGKEVSCDILALEHVRGMGLPVIDVFPGVDIKSADEGCRRKLGDVSRSLPARVKRRLWLKRSHVREERPRHFQPEVFGMDQVYLEGYWQSERYFRDIREELLKEFAFPEPADRRNRELAEKMGQEVSVSVHVRRGDYLMGKNKEIYGGVCTDAYYDRAVAYFQEKFRNPHFYFFSNDPKWVAERFRDIRMTAVDWNQGAQSHWDMYLMSRCRHNVIANSSFSWWGAWLNGHREKEVVAPKFWFNPKAATAVDTVCEGWIKMEG